MDHLDSGAPPSSLNQIDQPAEASATSLQQFILGQLNNSNSPQLKARNGFMVPKLQLGNHKFAIPLLKTSTSNADVSSAPNIRSVPLLETKSVQDLSTEVKKLSLETDSKTPVPAIDLTAALSDTSLRTSTNGSSPTLKATLTTSEDFEIPFIECDRQLLPRAPRITWDDHEPTPPTCISLAAPSACGRIICLNYRHMRQMPYINHRFKVKHKIQRFHFDTQSPDDLVQASISLNQFQRST